MAKGATDNPMMAMLFKTMGLDPGIIMKHATDLGSAFERLMTGQAEVLANQQAQGDLLRTIAMHLGIAAPLNNEMALMIAEQSRKHMGGTIMADFVPGGGMEAIAYQKLEEILKIREGVKLHTYYDTAQPPRLTGGIGHLITDDDYDAGWDHEGMEITQEQCDAWFREDAQGAMEAAKRQMTDAGITSPDFLPWLASVCFQLGNNWTDKFNTTWGMIKGGHYAGAADHLLSTTWARQTPVRVQDFARALKALPPKPTGQPVVVTA